MEFQKKISPKASYFLRLNDPDEIAYKRNIKLVPDEILKKYCNLFSIKDGKIKKLRLLLQDMIGNQQLLISAKIGMWSHCYPSTKIIFINFVNYFSN